MRLAQRPRECDSTLDPMRRPRAETVAYHHRAVARVLGAMRQHFHEDLSLGDMADIALISPYHFNRIFRRMAGIPPRRFLSALRLETALFAGLFATEDQKTGMQSFVENGPGKAQFTGR